MNLKESTILIFETVYERLKPFHELMKTNPAIIAYSGGKDSTLLCNFYRFLSNKSKSIEPILFHLDHSIRNNFEQEKEIILEMKTLSSKTFIKKKNIPQIAKRLKKSLEDTGRLIRYRYLKKLAIKNNGYITTGHHSNDYLETLLIHFIRGGGYMALTSLPIYREGIFRPLMGFTESEIESILNSENWKIFEDESNDSDLYLRNRIRKNIIPLLKKEGLDTHKLYENFHNVESLIVDKNGNLVKTKIPSYIRVDKNSLKNISLGNLKTILDAYANILKIHPFTKNILTTLQKELQTNTSFLIENKEVLLWKAPSSDLFLLPTSSQVLKKPKCVTTDTSQILTWNSTAKSISLQIKVDSWQQGLKILKNGKHREVSELLREKQIPVPVREFIPVLFKENEVCGILFSLWDDRIRDFIGDFYL